MAGIESQLMEKVQEALTSKEYPPEELANMVARFYFELIEQKIDETWARKLTEVYLSGL